MNKRVFIVVIIVCFHPLRTTLIWELLTNNTHYCQDNIVEKIEAKANDNIVELHVPDSLSLNNLFFCQLASKTGNTESV